MKLQRAGHSQGHEGHSRCPHVQGGHVSRTVGFSVTVSPTCPSKMHPTEGGRGSGRYSPAHRAEAPTPQRPAPALLTTLSPPRSGPRAWLRRGSTWEPGPSGYDTVFPQRQKETPWLLSVTPLGQDSQEQLLTFSLHHRTHPRVSCRCSSVRRSDCLLRSGRLLGQLRPDPRAWEALLSSPPPAAASRLSYGLILLP